MTSTSWPATCAARMSGMSGRRGPLDDHVPNTILTDWPPGWAFFDDLKIEYRCVSDTLRINTPDVRSVDVRLHRVPVGSLHLHSIARELSDRHSANA